MAKFDLQHLPPEVAAPLLAYYRRQRVLRLVRIVLATATVYGLLVLVAVHLDRFLFLDQLTRVWITRIVSVIAGALGSAGIAALLWRRPSVNRIAYELEARLPDAGGERLVTLHDVLSRNVAAVDGVSRQLRQELQRQTVALANRISGGKLVKDRVVRWLGLGAIVVAAVFGLLLIPGGYEFRLMLHRFYAPSANLPKPSFVKLQVINPPALVGRGEEIVIQAELTSEIPGWAKWALQRLGMPVNQCLIGFHPGADENFDLDDVDRESMNRVDRRLFLYTRSDLQETVSFKLRCGDAETQMHIVKVVTQPRVTDLQLLVQQPAYTGLPEATITDFGKPLRFLPETRITVSFATDQPVVKQEIRFARQPEAQQPEFDAASQRYRYEFTLKKKTGFEIVVENDQHFQNVERRQVNLGIYEDGRPNVRLVEPSANLRLVPAELVPITAELDDDLGLKDMAIVYLVNPDPAVTTPPQEIPVALPEGTTTKAALTAVFDMEKIEVGPGDTIQLFLRAKDSAGNYGESHKISIDIVAFTRGENERRRLVRLDFLRETGRDLAAARATKAPAADAFAVAADTFEKLSGRARDLGIELNGRDSLQPLLDLVENEIHFTDSPLHKQDLRRLSALLRAAGRSFDPSAGDADAWRARQLRVIDQDILSGLFRYRRLQNIIFRYYGLRYEAGNIITKIEKMEAGESTKDQRNSLIKRATLYLKSLEDLGEELSNLARESELLDLKSIQDLLGEMNTRGYYMKTPRGSLSRRAASAKEVLEQINTMLAGLQPKLLVLADQEAQARQVLAREYQQHLLRLADAKVARSADLRQRAAVWINADAHLQQWDPFLPFWAAFRDYALGQLLTAEYDPAKARALLVPGDRARRELELAETINRRLGFDREIDTILELPNLATAERVLAIYLILLQEARLNNESVGAILARLQTLKPDVDPEFDGDKLQRQRREWWAGIQQSQVEAKIMAEARRLWTFKPLAEVMQERRQAVQARTAAMRELVKTRSADAEAIQKQAEAIIPAAIADADLLDDLCQRVALELYDPQLTPAAKAQLDRLLQAMREQRGRVHVRFTMQFQNAQLIRPGSINTKNLDAFFMELDQFTNVHQWAGARLDSLLELYQKPDADASRKVYSAMVDLERSQQYSAAFEKIIGGADAPAMATEFMTRFPGMVLVYLYANRGSVVGAFDELSRAEVLLKAETVDDYRYNAALETADKLLQQFTAAVRRSGEGEVQEKLLLGLGTVAAKLSQLRLAKDADAARLSKVRFDLNAAVRELDRVCTEVLDLDSQEDPVKGFSGRPALPGEEKRDIEAAEERLFGQIRAARRQEILAMLAGLQPPVAGGTMQEGLAWALWEERLTRADINEVRASGAGSGTVQTTKLSLQKWLMEENDKARENLHSLQNYKDVQKLYHEVTGDLLRH